MLFMKIKLLIKMLEIRFLETKKPDIFLSRLCIIDYFLSFLSNTKFSYFPANIANIMLLLALFLLG